jgi:hypothetical protein
MSRLIDADKYRKEFLDSRDFEPMKILDFQPTVKAIPIDKIKEAREEIEKLDLNDYGDNLYQFQAKCTEILDKLIESED